MLQEGGIPSGPESGLLSNTQEVNYPRRHVLTEKKTLLGRAPGGRAAGQGNPGGLLYHVTRSLGFYGDEIFFHVVFGQSLWLRGPPGGAHVAQPR